MSAAAVAVAPYPTTPTSGDADTVPLPPPRGSVDKFAFPAGAWAQRDVFSSEHQREIYNQSLGGKAIGDYDPQGFLASLGLTQKLGAAGRTDFDMFKAQAASKYEPDPKYLPGPSWLASAVQAITQFFSHIWAGFGDAFSAVFGVFTKDTLGDKALSPYGEPFVSAVDARAVGDRYVGARRVAADAVLQNAFEASFHEGSIAREGAPGFGTFDIASGIGFNTEQATRIARANFNVDTDETGWLGADGKARVTKGTQGGDLHFHFNMAKDGEEDTRLVAAQTHLDRAVTAAKLGQYDAAEQELGTGLHSLQDVFAHGQIRPVTHAFLGTFPDHLVEIPVNAYEAQQATEGYLKKYLSDIGALTALPVAKSPTGRAMSFARLSTVADLPACAKDLLRSEGIRFFVTSAAVTPASLGFGADLDGDGVIAGARDIDGDGVISAFENETARADGRDWSAVPAGYDAGRQVGFVTPEAARSREIVRHELMHALVARIWCEPNAAAAMQNTWQTARDRGVFELVPPSVQEFFAESLAGMDNDALSRAIHMLRAGTPLP